MLFLDPLYFVPVLLVFLLGAVAVGWRLLKHRPWPRLLEVVSVVLLVIAVLGLLFGAVQLFGFAAIAATIGLGFLNLRGLRP